MLPHCSRQHTLQRDSTARPGIVSAPDLLPLCLLPLQNKFKEVTESPSISARQRPCKSLADQVSHSIQIHTNPFHTNIAALPCHRSSRRSDVYRQAQHEQSLTREKPETLKGQLKAKLTPLWIKTMLAMQRTPLCWLPFSALRSPHIATSLMHPGDCFRSGR